MCVRECVLIKCKRPGKYAPTLCSQKNRYVVFKKTVRYLQYVNVPWFKIHESLRNVHLIDSEPLNLISRRGNYGKVPENSNLFQFPQKYILKSWLRTPFPSNGFSNKKKRKEKKDELNYRILTHVDDVT